MTAISIAATVVIYLGENRWERHLNFAAVENGCWKVTNEK